MKRRGFLSCLGALVTTAIVPSEPSIPLGRLYNPLVLKMAMNSIYGKFGADIVSRYPYRMSAQWP